MEKYIEVLKKYKLWISSPLFALLFSVILYYLSNSSTYLSFIIILLSFLIPVIIILYKELKIRSNQIKSIKGIIRDMIVVIKILNNKGDALIQSKIKIINKDDNPVEFLYKDIYSTPGKSIKLLKPKIISSSIRNITLKERVKNYYKKIVKLDGNDYKYKYVDCDYRISPPLREVNDFIEYELTVDAKRYYKPNNNGNGNIEGFIVKNIATSLEMNLISPNNRKLKILDYWVEDCQANRIAYLKSIIIPPKIVSNGNQIKWLIEYPRMNCLYLFKYKISKRKRRNYDSLSK